MVIAAWALLVFAVDGGTARLIDWDVPQMVAFARVGEKNLEVNGLPLNIVIASSKWKGNDLLLHYARRFEQAGFFLPPTQNLHGLELPHLTALDAENMISYLVFWRPDPDGTTTLVLGAADLSARRPKTDAGGMPVFPGAKHATSFNLEVARGMSFEANATAAEVIDFYRSTLPAAGYAEREPGVFVKGQRLIRVLAKKAGAGLSVVVLDEPDLDGLGARAITERSVAPGTR